MKRKQRSKYTMTRLLPKMPVRLKKFGATYRFLVNKVFKDQIGRNIDVYVDNMVIKSTNDANLLRDVKETFKMLEK